MSKQQTSSSEKAPLQVLRCIVDRFRTAEADPKAYGREVAIAKKLYNKYPNAEFWQEVPLYHFTLPSLAYFLKNNGKVDLNEKYQLFLATRQAPKPVLSAEKLGEDIIIEKKIKTLKDFLNS